MASPDAGTFQLPPSSPLSALPDCLLISILRTAFPCPHDACDPLRTVVPLVCRRWRDLLRSPAAAELFFTYLAISDRCLLPARRFDAGRLERWFGDKAFVVQVLEVDLSPAVSNPTLLASFSSALGRALRGSSNLRSLSLAGQLQLGPLCEGLSAAAPTLSRLSSLCLAGGGSSWGVLECLQALRQLPALRQLQVKFASEAEPPEGLPAAACAFPGLRRLLLCYPFPGAIPPASDLPAQLSSLAQLSTLALKWVPAQGAPGWLGALSQLQHLYYDPYLPADAPGLLPSSTSALTALRTLVTTRRLCSPTPIPLTLTNLETLHMRGPGLSLALDQDWEWLGVLTKLQSLRLNSVGLREVPEALCRLGLTRLELMCNQLEDLPPGAYLETLQVLHLGNNNIGAFPPALRVATALRMLYLANQRSDLVPRKVDARLRMTLDDVSALAALGPTLETLILGLAQPLIELPAAAPQQKRRARKGAAAGVQQPPAPPAAQHSSACTRPAAAGTCSPGDASGPSCDAAGPAVAAAQVDTGDALPAPATPTARPGDREPAPAGDTAGLDRHAGQQPGSKQLGTQQQAAAPAAARSPVTVGFDWLQRALRKRGVRLTSSELTFEFEQLAVFDLRLGA